MPGIAQLLLPVIRPTVPLPSFAARSLKCLPRRPSTIGQLFSLCVYFDLYGTPTAGACQLVDSVVPTLVAGAYYLISLYVSICLTRRRILIYFWDFLQKKFYNIDYSPSCTIPKTLTGNVTSEAVANDVDLICQRRWKSQSKPWIWLHFIVCFLLWKYHG